VGVAYPVAAMTIVRSELGCTAARQLVLGGTNRDSARALSSGIVDELQAAEHLLTRSETVARQPFDVGRQRDICALSGNFARMR